MERRENEDFFKKAVYVLLTVILSMSGYDVVKKENPVTIQRLDNIDSKIEKLEQNFTKLLDNAKVKNVTMSNH